MQLKPTYKYDDIIYKPHHVSGKRAAMAMIDRAAQFSPFAGLTGYEAVIAESGRLTDSATELTEGSKQALDRRLRVIADNLQTLPWVSVTYFQPDSRKTGGSYVTVTGQVKRIDEYDRVIVFTDGREVPLDRLYRLDGALIDGVD